MLLKLEGFMYVSYLDLNMGYYNIELSPGSKKLCTTLLPGVITSTKKYPWGSTTIPIFSKKIYTNYSKGLAR